jgi:MFS family permease
MMAEVHPKNLLKVACHPPKYLLASLVVCVGGLLNGYAENPNSLENTTTFPDLICSLDTGVIGPVTTMPIFIDYFGELSSTTRGIVVSSVLLSATFASLFAGTLSDTMGRTRAVGIGSAGFALGAALEAGASNLGMLIAGRLIVGVGEGLFLSTLVV